MANCLEGEKLEKSYLEQLENRRLEKAIEDAGGQVEDVRFFGKSELFCPREHLLFGSTNPENLIKYPNFPLAIPKGVSVSLVRNLRNILQWMYVATAYPTSQNILVKLNPLSKEGRVVGDYPNRWNIFALAYPDRCDRNA